MRQTNEEGLGTRHFLLYVEVESLTRFGTSILSILNMDDQEFMIIVSWDELIWRSFKELSLPRVVPHFLSWAICLEGNQTLQVYFRVNTFLLLKSVPCGVPMIAEYA